MNQISMKVTLTYRWWRGNKRAIPRAHVERLQEHAMAQINDQMRQGYSSGELSLEIGHGAKAGIEYQGWWATKTEETE